MEEERDRGGERYCIFAYIYQCNYSLFIYAFI